MWKIFILRTGQKLDKLYDLIFTLTFCDQGKIPGLSLGKQRLENKSPFFVTPTWSSTCRGHMKILWNVYITEKNIMWGIVIAVDIIISVLICSKIVRNYNSTWHQNNSEPIKILFV